MLRGARKAAVLALALALATTALFETFSFGIAHGNLFLVALCLGTVIASVYQLPGLPHLGAVFGYQLAYFAVLACAVWGVTALHRIRSARLATQRLREHVS